MAVLRDFNLHRDDNANERNGAFRFSCRDELVTTLGPATQVDQPHTTSNWDLPEASGPVEDLLR